RGASSLASKPAFAPAFWAVRESGAGSRLESRLASKTVCPTFARSAHMNLHGVRSSEAWVDRNRGQPSSAAPLYYYLSSRPGCRSAPPPGSNRLDQLCDPALQERASVLVVSAGQQSFGVLEMLGHPLARLLGIAAPDGRVDALVQPQGVFDRHKLRRQL